MLKMNIFLIFLPSIIPLLVSATMASDTNFLNIRIPYEGALFYNKPCQAYHITLDEPKVDVTDEHKKPIIEQSLPLNFTFGNVTVDPPHFLLKYPVLNLPQVGRECTKMELEFFDYSGESVAASQASCHDRDIDLMNITYIVPPAKSVTLSIRSFYFGNYLNNSLEIVLIPTWPNACPPGIFGDNCVISDLRNAVRVDEFDSGSYCFLPNNEINCSNITQSLFTRFLPVIIVVPVVAFLGVVFCVAAIIYRRKKKRLILENIDKYVEDWFERLGEDYIERFLKGRIERLIDEDIESHMYYIIKTRIDDRIEKYMFDGIQTRIDDSIERYVHDRIKARIDDRDNQHIDDWTEKPMNISDEKCIDDNIEKSINVRIKSSECDRIKSLIDDWIKIRVYGGVEGRMKDRIKRRTTDLIGALTKGSIEILVNDRGEEAIMKKFMRARTNHSSLSSLLWQFDDENFDMISKTYR